MWNFLALLGLSGKPIQLITCKAEVVSFNQSEFDVLYAFEECWK